jgi:hypothetical protein
MELGVSWIKATNAKNRSFAHTAFFLNIVTDKNLNRGAFVFYKHVLVSLNFIKSLLL